MNQTNKLTTGAMAILSVAEVLFAKKGFKATSISDIAKMADVSKANIYHHFKSKEDLYVTALEQACEKIFDESDFLQSSTFRRPEETLSLYLQQHLKYILSNPAPMNLIKRELMDNNEVEGSLLAKDIFINSFLKVEALVCSAHGIEKNSQNLNTSLQTFLLIGANLFFFDLQSVLQYLPGFSSIAKSPELFSDKSFKQLFNKNTSNLIQSEKSHEV